MTPDISHPAVWSTPENNPLITQDPPPPVAATRPGSIPVSHLFLYLTYISSIVVNTHVVHGSGMPEDILSVVVIASSLVYFFYLQKRSGFIPSLSDLSTYWLFYTYLLSLIVIQLSFHLDAHTVFNVAAFTITSVIFFHLIPSSIMVDKLSFLRFIKLVSASSFVLSLTALYGAFVSDHILGIELFVKDLYANYSGIPSSGGLLEHPIILGMQCAYGMLTSIFLWKKTASPIYLVFLAVCLMALLLAQSRGEILAVAFGIAILFSPMWILRRSWLLLLSILFLVASLQLVFFVIESNEYLSAFFRTSTGMSGRQVLWPAAIELGLERPLTGHGFKTAAQAMYTYTGGVLPGYYGDKSDTMPVHSTFLAMFVDSGIIVVLTYTALFVFGIFTATKADLDDDTTRLLTAAVVTSLISAAFTDNNIGGVRSTSVTLSVLLGCAFSRPRGLSWLQTCSINRF